MYKEDALSHMIIVLMVVLFSVLLSFGMMNLLSSLTKDALVNISAGILIASFIVSFFAFRETTGILLMVLVLSLVLSSILLTNVVYGLFISSIVVMLIVLMNILKH